MTVQTQTACSTERIESFLDHRLSEPEQRMLEEHLSDCPECRDRLGARTANRDLWDKASRYLRDDDFLVEPISGVEASTSDASIRQVLELLAPTDDPQMLGRLGSYEVSGVIGAGGMGVVLKAFDRSLDRTVAIKVLAPHLASSGAARNRFAREAKAAAAVLHPNVIGIHGVSNGEPLPYLVMSCVKGTSLQKRIEAEGPLSPGETLRIGAQIAAGLAAAHAQGLVHRDITPSNILLEEGVERVAITDFGLARAVDDATMTRSGVITGTPQYMSPEQARGESLDHRSDLFSLGSVLYAMCTGHSPFRAESTLGVLRRISDDPPRPLREINPHVPDWLAAIIDRLLAKNPDERFQSAAEVSEQLEQWLAWMQQPSAVPRPKAIRATSPRRVASFLKLALLTAGIGTLLTAVVFVVQLGETSIRFEIDDPSLAVKFGEKQITIENDGDTIQIAPGKENSFTVLQSGSEVTGNSFVLKKGENVALRVSVAKGGDIKVSSDPALDIKRRELPGPVLGAGKKAGDETQFLLLSPPGSQLLCTAQKRAVKLPGRFRMQGTSLNFLLSSPEHSKSSIPGVLTREPMTATTKRFLSDNAISLKLSEADLKMAGQGRLTKYVFLPHLQPGEKWSGHLGTLTMGSVGRESDKEVRRNMKERGTLLAVLHLGKDNGKPASTGDSAQPTSPSADFRTQRSALDALNEINKAHIKSGKHDPGVLKRIEQYETAFRLQSDFASIQAKALLEASAKAAALEAAAKKEAEANLRAAEAAELVKGVGDRFEAIRSGIFSYRLTRGREKPDTDAEFKFTFNGKSWRLEQFNDRLFKRTATKINHNGRLFVSGGSRGRIFQPRSPFEETQEPPPFRAGTVWEERTHRYLIANSRRVRLAGEKEVNGFTTKVIELDIPREDLHKALDGVHPALEKSATLRLYVSPKLGHVLIRYEQVGPKNFVPQRRDFFQFSEVWPGLYLPFVSQFEAARDEVSPYKTRYEIKGTLLINRAIPDTAFKMPAGINLLRDERPASSRKANSSRRLRQIVASPNGSLLADLRYNIVVLGDARTRSRQARTIDIGSPGKTIVFSADGKQIGVLTEEGVKYFEVGTGKLLRFVREEEWPAWPNEKMPDKPSSVPQIEPRARVISPDGSLIGSLFNNGIDLSDTETKKIVRIIRMTVAAKSLQFSADGSEIAAVSNDGVRYFTVHDGELARFAPKARQAKWEQPQETKE